MTLFRAFLLSTAVAMTGVVGLALASREPTRAPVERPSVSHPLTPSIHVRDQLKLPEIGRIKSAGYRTIIDLRPDGEAPDQPGSEAVRKAAEAEGLRFAYVPTPRGNIPDATVDQLAGALAAAEGPVLLYCRSGSRAARVWALAEASRVDGPDKALIADAVRKAGQEIDDLTPRIEARIAARRTAAN
ncbi:MAG: TIGR01244 family sulfur transferase [Hyphomicrobiaceae bacterium]